MIRRLAADELAWFMRQALEFSGHADPSGLALKLQRRLRDPAGDAARSFVLFDKGAPLAGAFLRESPASDSARTVTLTSVWHSGKPEALADLVKRLLADVPHEAASLPLHLLPEGRCAELTEALAPLGFTRDRLTNMRFELSEVPPLGTPLVLEAYSQDEERAFRDLYRRCEGQAPSDAAWSYLKRRSGPFRPDFWFQARETLDQEPVGYAFCSSRRRGVDATYGLDGAGVLQELRHDSEMLRRLVLSLLHELSGASPLGAVEASLPSKDPKLIEILASLGFQTRERLPVLLREPV